MSALLTETASYDEPGSWGRMSKGYPEIKGDDAHKMYVFAGRCETIPYGSYVWIEKGYRGAKESVLRVQAQYIKQLKADFKAAGSPTEEQSIARSERYGKKDRFGNRGSAPKWW